MILGPSKAGGIFEHKFVCFSFTAGSFLDSRRSSAPNVQVKAEAVDGSGSNALKQFVCSNRPLGFSTKELKDLLR